jgi:hypothetical protein
MVKLPTNDDSQAHDLQAAAPVSPRGDDDMVSGMPGSGFTASEATAADDQAAIDKETAIFSRLEPVLEFLNNTIDEEVEAVSNIKSLIIKSVANTAMPAEEDVRVELRARSMHLDFLEKFRARIKNTQNTIEELRNG